MLTCLFEEIAGVPHKYLWYSTEVEDIKFSEIGEIDTRLLIFKKSWGKI